jgi:hypothetical protein
MAPRSDVGGFRSCKNGALTNTRGLERGVWMDSNGVVKWVMPTQKAVIENKGGRRRLGRRARRVPLPTRREMLGSIRARTAGQKRRVRVKARGRVHCGEAFQWNWLGRCRLGNEQGLSAWQAPLFLMRWKWDWEPAGNGRVAHNSSTSRGRRANRKAATSPWSFSSNPPLGPNLPTFRPWSRPDPCSRNPLRMHHSRVACDTALLADLDCRGHHQRRLRCQLGGSSALPHGVGDGVRDGSGSDPRGGGGRQGQATWQRHLVPPVQGVVAWRACR